MKYDVVIVGGGSAGCTLATRLSEDPNRSVLLPEAGPDYPDPELLPDEIKFGSNNGASEVDSPFNWSYEARGSARQSRPMDIARGKVIGGSGSINGQVFLRGVPEDYDRWASWGNDEWSYINVLPYFRRQETDTDISDDFHGFDGPIPVRRHRRENWLPLQEAFVQACTEVGYAEVYDHNHPDSTGVGPFPMNNPNGVRMSTALTYVNPNRHRLNLTIRANVRVQRILFETGSTGSPRAVGVEVESGGETFQIEAEQIVLCAGAVASPQLLMLSGVGPAAELGDLGIAVVKDLPGVGKNLRDHPLVPVRVKVKDDFALDPDAPRIQTVLRYTASGSDTRNDMQIFPSSFSTPLGGDPYDNEGIRVTCMMELAESAGELTLQSTDPDVQPHIDCRYLEADWDRERMREAIRIVLRLLDHEQFRDIYDGLISPTEADLVSDDALDNWMLREVCIGQHLSGTCKMGPDSDPMAVVDQHCRVHGIESLRVADASVMPDVIRANTNCTTIMIGERVAEWVRAGQ